MVREAFPWASGPHCTLLVCSEAAVGNSHWCETPVSLSQMLWMHSEALSGGVPAERDPRFRPREEGYTYALTTELTGPPGETIMGSPHAG